MSNADIYPDPSMYRQEDIDAMFRPEFPLPVKIRQKTKETCRLWDEIQAAEKAFAEQRYFDYDIATDNIHAMLNVLHVEQFLTDQEYQDASNRYGLGIVVTNGRLRTDVELFSEFYRNSCAV